MISNSGPEWKNYKPKSDVSIIPKQPKIKTTSKAIEIIRSISKILPLSPKIHKEFISSSTDIFYDVHKKGLEQAWMHQPEGHRTDVARSV